MCHKEGGVIYNYATVFSGQLVLIQWNNKIKINIEEDLKKMLHLL